MLSVCLFIKYVQISKDYKLHDSIAEWMKNTHIEIYIYLSLRHAAFQSTEELCEEELV